MRRPEPSKPGEAGEPSDPGDPGDPNDQPVQEVQPVAANQRDTSSRSEEAAGIVPPAPSKVAPEDIGLRTAPHPVTRLNRRTLMGLAGSLAVFVFGVTLWSLQPSKRRAVGQELHNVGQVSPSDAVTQLPSDYSMLASSRSSDLFPDIPKLGPPLPGDLGPALVRAQDAARVGDLLGGADAALAEHEAMRKAAETAAASPVFFRSGNQSALASVADPSMSREPGVEESPAGSKTTASAEVSYDPRDGEGSVLGNQEQREPPGASVSKDGSPVPGLQLPASPYQVMAGTVIPAALVTGIQSDLPGEVIGTVTEPVFDTATGQHLLIPQGSRILGKYNEMIGFGQRRVQVAWNRIIFPDTSSVTLNNLIGTDAAGYAGLQDGVDWHWDRLFAGAALTTLLGVAAELAAPGDRQHGDRVILAGRDGLQNSVNGVGQEVVRRNLDVQPTLTQRPGFPLRIVVNRDLVLRPYKPLLFQRQASP
ncbi:TrbI/VirB10 family protein [Cupriavidus pauculus]|uniref:Conjugal transfer protein TrbI n=1 Tax=Cupriavidus pauculus TaxID=82633 RepID=A0A2N5C6P2_9BURK|nr:TrbI/VirB10 family protein [Cupriavidus pauculus]PLP97892.1 conjugal transfer protein TrbI [Cupriavidus pauculus]